MRPWTIAITALGLYLTGSAMAFAQPNVTLDSPYQIHYAAGLSGKETKVTITNSGARGASPTDSTVGALCANVYAFDVAGSMLACCSCLIAPNALEQLSVARHILEDPAVVPGTVVLKALASVPASSGPLCNASAPGALTNGMLAWKDHGGATESNPFSPSTLSVGELSKLSAQCLGLHPSAHVCRSCQP